MEKNFKAFAETTREKRKIQKIGNSLMVAIPDTFLEWAGLKLGKTATVVVDVNKKGQRYIAIFK